MVDDWSRYAVITRALRVRLSDPFAPDASTILWITRLMTERGLAQCSQLAC